MEPAELLEDLRARVQRFFLAVGGLVALSSTGFIVWLRKPFWELAGIIAFCSAGLIALGNSPRWRWGLHLFVGVALGAVAVDVALAREAPLAVLFLPLVVFYAGMLSSRRVTLGVLACSLALCAASGWRHPGTPGYRLLLLVLGMLTPVLAALSLGAQPIYQGLLEELREEEERLHANLGSYRRLVSTLFHDLANPLAVLQGLAALPPLLRGPADLERARRMVERLRAVSDSARFASLSQDPELSPLSVGELADGLNDLFEERLRARQLGFRRGPGMELRLRQGGSLLRDSILGNLLSNAIKYSPQGGTLSFSARRDAGGTWLSLADVGPGFPASTLRDLAEGKAPLPQPGEDGELGSGFGLLLARSYARDLGGQLRLSNQGGGLAELWLPD